MYNWYIIHASAVAMCASAVRGMFVMACLSCIIIHIFAGDLLSITIFPAHLVSRRHTYCYSKRFSYYYTEKYARKAINNVMSARDNTPLEQYQWRWWFEKSIFILFYKYTPSLWLLWLFYVYNIARTEQSNCHATLVEKFRT